MTSGLPLPAARSRNERDRSSGALSPHTATAEIPAAVNWSAMKRAWATETQKPSALIACGSAVLSRTCSMTRRAHAWSAVSTLVNAVTSYPVPRFHGTSVRSVPSCTPKYENGTKYCWSIASHTRSSAAIPPSK